MTLNRREFLKWLSASAGARRTGGMRNARLRKRCARRCGPRRRDRRRLRRRDGREIREDVGARHRCRAGRARRAFHLLPDQQSRPGGQYDDAGNHDGPREAAQPRRAHGARRSGGDRPGRSAKCGSRAARRSPTTASSFRPASISYTTGSRGYAARKRSSACRTRGKPGSRRWLLRKQLEAMRDGGVYVLHIPLAPYPLPAGTVRARVPGCGLSSSARSRNRRSSCSTRNPEHHVERKAFPRGVGTAHTRA